MVFNGFIFVFAWNGLVWVTLKLEKNKQTVPKKKSPH